MVNDSDRTLRSLGAVPQMSGARDLMACRKCGLVKAAAQFQEHGCENCEPGEGMTVETLQSECTSKFSGLIAIMDPERSWCARWTRKKKYVPACYALKMDEEEMLE